MERFTVHVVEIDYEVVRDISVRTILSIVREFKYYNINDFVWSN